MQSEVNELKIKREWSPWGVSVVTHCVVIGTLVFLPGSPSAATPARVVTVTPLIYPPVIKAPPPLRAPRILREPPVKLASLTTPPENIPKPIVKQFQAFIPEQPKAIAIQAPEQIKLVEASLTPAKLATPDLPTRLAPAVPVKTNVFASSSGAAADGHVPASHLDVHTGGFGGTDGSPVQSGGGKGNGSAIHTGGFGDSNGSGSGGSGSGNGKPAVVASAGFGNATVQNPAPRRTETAPSETPVEVLWKPKPVYTDEARAKKLEGNVTLEVIFHATGQVEVLRVTRGLGGGLDQSARTAAEQIRFRPGKKDGVPVDKTGLVQITFELS
jgi:TonB family protein